ncbi:TonB-dependent receptor [Flammeovirgaceae bacterium SG7u.111]|nr:TonB-dependent receptor [Flammeovirgaceae bacterium SG7u.132]WPO34513.1 TonB-dependent receptor [Flammeovirgaceae bacterium SG7u.111]
MRNHNSTFFKSIVASLAMILFMLPAYAQTSITGKVTDKETGEPMVGTNIVIKGMTIGATTDIDGNFKLQTKVSPPFTLVFSSIGYDNQEVEVTSASQVINMGLASSVIMGQEVVVSASRIEENIMESPVTVEKMGILDIQETATPDFYDAIANMKGVQVNKGSLTFTSVNTRGFATNANTRFVQLVDMIDNSAPLLNFPTGNLVGIDELDLESVELVPGAASALYGPNAFNGILFMTSKNPFDYQGLSAQVKSGVTRSDAQGETNPMWSGSIRYAKVFNDKLAVKVNFSMLDATDWVGNDYASDRRYPNQFVSNDPGITPDFDGLNMYGDEFKITIPINTSIADAAEAGLLPGLPASKTLADGFRTLDPISVTRTGLREEDIIDAYEAKSIKADAAIHYKINDDLEASYTYRYGSGSSIYQGGEKYAIRGFSQQFHKAELQGKNYFLRGYATLTDAGDSYNMTALATFTNEEFSPTAARWAPTYGIYYGLARLGLLYQADPSVPAGKIYSEEEAHRIARGAADAPPPPEGGFGIPPAGSPRFNEVVKDVRENRYFQRNPPGARFIDNSRTYHVEGNYNFADVIDWAELMVGGNFRRYSLLSEGTIFNEDPENGENFERIAIDEFGIYAQIAKKFIEDRLKLTGSLRFDKNENFEGQITPRISAVMRAGDNHHFRTSFQTGFRNPDTQAQFIYFPSTSGILLGGTESNAGRYGIYKGGAISPRTGETLNLDYVQPEKLSVWEVGYKSIINGNVMVDVNYYYNWYQDFMNQIVVASKEPSTHQGQTLPAGTLFAPYINAEEEITSQGIGLGVTYKLPKGFTFNGNYNWAKMKLNEDEGSDFIPDFNTPENRFSLSLANRDLVKNLGFNVSYRWQQQFYWWNTFGAGNMPSYDVVDAQVSYRIKSIKSMIKVGGSNLFGGDYRTSIGAPFVGQMYYISVTFDEAMR